MFNVGGGEVLVILVLALVVLGPDKLPEAARTFGKHLGDFRRLSGGFKDEIANAMSLQSSTPAAAAEPAPVATPASTTPAPTRSPAPEPAAATPVRAESEPMRAAIEVDAEGEAEARRARVHADGPVESFA